MQIVAWTTLYDVSRDGIGLTPWLLVMMWIAGICAGAIAIKRSPIGRVFITFWLVAWVLMGGVGFGNIFYQYEQNRHALKAALCRIVEGEISNFHRQVPFKKGDSERFTVGGEEFSYSNGNLGSGGLRSSASFNIPLAEGLNVRIWSRNKVICRLDVLR